MPFGVVRTSATNDSRDFNFFCACAGNAERLVKIAVTRRSESLE
jgi:hypothetical protein